MSQIRQKSDLTAPFVVFLTFLMAFFARGFMMRPKATVRVMVAPYMPIIGIAVVIFDYRSSRIVRHVRGSTVIGGATTIVPRRRVALFKAPLSHEG